jgi:hypothetical protein
MLDEYLETVQRLGSATSELLEDSIANLILGLTDETGRIVGLDIMAERFDTASVSINDLIAEARQLSGDPAVVEQLRHLTVGTFEVPAISLVDATGTSINFPAMSVTAMADAPDHLAADDTTMTPEQIRERAGDIQREAAWSLVKNFVQCLVPGGAVTGLPEAYGDLTQLATELRDLQREVDRAHIIRIPEVVIVGHPEAPTPTITMPEVVIHGHPSGPVIVMPQVVITSGDVEDDDRDNGDNGNDDQDNGENDNDDEGDNGNDTQADDGEGLGDDTGGGDIDIPVGSGSVDVGGVDDGEGLGDDTGMGPLPPGISTGDAGKATTQADAARVTVTPEATIDGLRVDRLIVSEEEQSKG